MRFYDATNQSGATRDHSTGEGRWVPHPSTHSAGLEPSLAENRAMLDYVWGII